jgi:hypothetical protein
MWNLKYENTTKSLYDWGIYDVSRVLKNQCCDRVTFRSIGDIRFNAEELIEINFRNAIWFKGLIVKTPFISSAEREENGYELAGPWWYLENLVFQQEWREMRFDNCLSDDDNSESTENVELKFESISKGRLILGQGINGDRINAREQIIEIINYAIQCGAPIQIGDITPLVQFPFDEAKDLSCAEAILKVLRWSPDVVTYFDYSTSPFPTLHIKERRFQENLNLALEHEVKSFRISPRYDLKVPSVVIKYEKTHSANGNLWSTTQTDIYPENATGKEFRSLVLTVELEGVKAHSVVQKVKTQLIQPESVQWWKKHLPGLEGIDIGKIQIRDIRRTSDLGNELIEGSIAHWMKVDVQEDLVQAKISYESEEEAVVDREVAVRINATSARSKTYHKWSTESIAEDVPVGLAEFLYEGISELQYEGEIEIETSEIGNLQFMGNKINFFGADESWQTMEASIQEVRETLDTGNILIIIGTAKHLGADDLIQLLRVNRSRFAAMRSGVRKTGSALDNNKLNLGTHSRIENTNQGPGKYQKILFVDPAHPKQTVIINAKDLPQALTVQLREENVCCNGEIQKRIVLASEPFSSTDEV